MSRYQTPTGFSYKVRSLSMKDLTRPEYILMTAMPEYHARACYVAIVRHQYIFFLVKEGHLIDEESEKQSNGQGSKQECVKQLFMLTA
jgi:hypothetical protein